MGASLPLQGLFLRQFSHGDRKDAGVINREFLAGCHNVESSAVPSSPSSITRMHTLLMFYPPGAVYRFGSRHERKPISCSCWKAGSRSTD